MDNENEDVDSVTSETESPAPEESVEAEPAVSVETDAPPSGSKPVITFRGNNYDLMSVVGATLAGGTLFACGTCGFGFYCLPFVPLILGIVGLFSLKESVDPDRTKFLSWASVAVGSLFVLLILAGIVFYILYFTFIFAMIAAEGGF